MQQQNAAISSWLAAQQNAMIQLLSELVNIDSGSYDKAGVDAVGAQLESFLIDHGISVTTTPNVHFGNILRAANGNPGSDSDRHAILLMGHRDTVFPKGEAARRPFHISGDRAYGPGVADMKAGLVMNAFIMAAFSRFAPQVPLVALMTGDEEIGSGTSHAFIEKEAKQAIAVFNSEPGRISGNVVTGRKGGFTYRFEITGIAAHSGVNFTEGASAIGELAHKITALHGLTCVENGITLNVGLVKGGQSVNTIAPDAHGEVDVRFVTNEQRDDLIRSVEMILSSTTTPGTSIKAERKSGFLPLVPTTESEALTEKYLSSANEMGLRISGEFTGGCADSGFAASVGAPTICGVGPVGGKAHTAEEYIEVASLSERARIVAATIFKLG
ncbi:peptidase M20 [Brucella endophytica]|uniref:Peptidase M20 n=1 Tax=Brucella endophytica TaxID=1963359 RepID=A0A916SPS6_9HYPH|nr:M20 family metallopeptidase [Brucella endophytica]GGB12031.1 peptidase M20 [Brucella endophytica]